MGAIFGIGFGLIVLGATVWLAHRVKVRRRGDRPSMTQAQRESEVSTHRNSPFI